MARTGQDFSMYSGNSKIIYITITDKLGKAVNLEGSNLKWVMKQRGSTIASKELGNGIGISNMDKARVLVTIKPEDTKGIIGDCKHELQVVDANNNVTTVTTGSIYVNPSLYA